MNLFWLSCLLVSTVLVNGNFILNESETVETSRFLLTLPQILTPKTSDVCITSLNGYIPEDNNVIVILIDPRTDKTIDYFAFKLESDSQCFKFETSNIHVDLVKVRVQMDPDLNVDRLIRFLPTYGMVMIETSKPVYQPGETLKFRVLGFDGLMKPWSDSIIKVTLYNADGVKVMVWKGADLEKGLKHYELLISQSSREGVWRIVGSTKFGDVVEKSFRVSQRVEPDVVLKIEHGGEYILSNEDKHRMVVCAEDKQGSVVSEGRIALKLGNEYKIPPTPVDESGCIHFYLTKDAFKLPARVGTQLAVTLEYNNELADVKLPVYIPVVRSHVHLRVPSSAMVKNYFKPGLPYFGYLLVERPDYTSLRHAEVKICYQTATKPWEFKNDTKKICKTFFSSAEGAIEFIIPPVALNTKQILIEATIPGVADHRQNFIVHPWEDEDSDQFIVKPIVRMRSCRQDYPEATKYTIVMSLNGTKPFEKLHMQTAGRASIKQTKALKLTPTPYTPDSNLLIGDWPENDNIYFADVWEDALSYSPLNRVIFYGLNSQGKLISDSISYFKECLNDETLVGFDVHENGELSVYIRAESDALCSISIGDSAERGKLTEQKINKMLEQFDDIYTKSFEWDKCSLELARRLERAPLLIDFKNNWDVFKEMGLHAVDSRSDIFEKPCQWDIFDKASRDLSYRAFQDIEPFLPYNEQIMTSLADSADMSHFARVEDKLVKDITFWGSRRDLETFLQKNPRILAGKPTASIHAICMDPHRGIRSHTRVKILQAAPIFLEFDLPRKITDKAIRDVAIFVRRPGSEIRLSECVPVTLEVESSDSFELKSELPTFCACSKTSKQILKVKPLKKGPLNLKVKAKYAPTLAQECNSMVRDFETQQVILKTNVEPYEPKVTRKIYEVACENAKKTLIRSETREDAHITIDLMNVFLKQYRDEQPIQKNIFEVLARLNGLVNLFDPAAPAALLPKVQEALQSTYQELALFRLPKGQYNIFGRAVEPASLVATALAYRTIIRAQAKIPIFGGSDVINPTFDYLLHQMKKDGCFNPSVVTNHHLQTKYDWPFNHEPSQLEMSAFITSVMPDTPQTPKIFLRTAIKCIDKLMLDEKTVSQMDKLTRSMIALVYTRMNRTDEAASLIEDIAFPRESNERRVSPRFQLKSLPTQSVTEEARARAFYVLVKLALNQTEKLEELLQDMVSSNLYLNDPIISDAVTIAWKIITEKERSMATIVMNNEEMTLGRYEMKKIQVPKSSGAMMFEVSSPGCALLERTEDISIKSYHRTIPFIDEDSEGSWNSSSSTATQRGFRILKGKSGESCDLRKIKICPFDAHKLFKIFLPPNYELATSTFGDFISHYGNGAIEMYRSLDGYTFISTKPYYGCFDVPMIKTGEMVSDEKPMAYIYSYPRFDFDDEPMVGSVEIENNCSIEKIRTRRSSENADNHKKSLNRSLGSQNPKENRNPEVQQQSEYGSGYETSAYQAPAYEAPTYQAPASEAPTKGYQPPPAQTYETPAYQAPAYEAPAYQAPAYEAPAKGYSQPAPAYQAQAYEAPAYQAPAYQAPAYEAPTYQAPAYEAPAKGYSQPAPAPAYQAPAYEAPTYQAPAYEAPAKGYSQPAPAPAYSAPAYEAPSYQAPAYEAPAKGYSQPAPAPAYQAPAYEAPAYQAPAYEAPSYQAPAYEAQTYQAPAYEAPAKGYSQPAPAYQPPAYEAPAKGYSQPAPTYQAPAYEAPAKGYSQPAPAYQAPAYQAPAYQASGYQAPAYQAPAYQAPAYEAPSYQAQAYVAPTYQAPAYEAPAKGYSPPPSPTYQPAYQAPVYEAPTYQAPAYEAPAKGYSQPAPAPAYQVPAYEAPTYQAPAYEAPAKGYSQPASAYAPPPPAYAPPPPAYAPPPPVYEGPYEAPAYEGPAKGYAPHASKGYSAPSYSPPSAYENPTYNAYRNTQGRTTNYRYEKSFASSHGPIGRSPHPHQRNLMLKPATLNPWARAQPRRTVLRFTNSKQIPYGASTELKPIISERECEQRRVAPTCPKCQPRLDVELIDKLCNSSVLLATVNTDKIVKSKEVTCGEFQGYFNYASKSSTTEKLSATPFSINSKCDCDEIDNDTVIILSDRTKDQQSSNEVEFQGKAFGAETIILPFNRENAQELRSYVELCSK